MASHGRNSAVPLSFSKNSTPAVPPSLWFASDFLLGAGMVIIQPETEKIVVIYDTKSKFWFLPKGRKDVGESLEQTALREAYEESGYQVEFLPLYTPTRAPISPGAPKDTPNTEPIYISTVAWAPRKSRRSRTTDNGGEYLSFYYVGQIPLDAVCHEGTGMPDEQNFTTYLLSVNEAIDKLGWIEGSVVHRAWNIWQNTLEIETHLRTEKGPQPSDRVRQVLNSTPAEPGVVFLK